MNTDVADTLNRLQTLRAEYENLTKTVGVDLVKALAKDVFAKAPVITKLKWSQYTPYFNDGDECVFSVHGVRFYVGDETAEAAKKLKYYDAEYGMDIWGKVEKVIEDFGQVLTEDGARALFAFDQFCQQYDRDILLPCFGDHVEVIVTREAIEVEDYYHE